MRRLEREYLPLERGIPCVRRRSICARALLRRLRARRAPRRAAQVRVE